MKNETKIEKMIEDLAASVARGFHEQNERFIKLEENIVWIKNILESHSTTLARLDQERIFTINHVERLESEIQTIKKFLKLA